MVRATFHILLVVSLILFLGMLLMWIRSYQESDGVELGYKDELCEIVSTRGQIRLDNWPQWEFSRRSLIKRAAAL